jgi:putative DNA primase/helicase
MLSETGRKHKAIGLCEEIPMEKHEVEFLSEALGWNKSWHEMSWVERFCQILAAVFGFGDDLVTLLASKIPPRKVKWLWQNRVPLGKLTLFVGNPDNGKSMVATYVTATVTTGRNWFDAKNWLPSGEVLIFANEDDPDDTTVPRLMASGANLSKVHLVGSIRVGEPGKTEEEREMKLDTDIKAIKKALTYNPNIRLVVIDPVSNYLGSTKMVDEQAVRRVLRPLKKLAEDTSVAILGIMHLNKKEDLKAINRVSGAMAFVGVARAVWLFCAAENQNSGIFKMLPLKKNIGPRAGGLLYRIDTKPVDIEGEADLQPYIEWTGETSESADAVLASRPVGRPRDEREKASVFLKELLRNGPLPSNEIEVQCKAAGFTYRTLERAKDEANSGVEVFREGDKWNWKLTD